MQLVIVYVLGIFKELDGVQVLVIALTVWTPVRVIAVRFYTGTPHESVVPAFWLAVRLHILLDVSPSRLLHTKRLLRLWTPLLWTVASCCLGTGDHRLKLRFSVVMTRRVVVVHLELSIRTFRRRTSRRSTRQCRVPHGRGVD